MANLLWIEQMKNNWRALGKPERWNGPQERPKQPSRNERQLQKPVGDLMITEIHEQIQGGGTRDSSGASDAGRLGKQVNGTWNETVENRGGDEGTVESSAGRPWNRGRWREDPWNRGRTAVGTGEWSNSGNRTEEHRETAAGEHKGTIIIND